MHKRNKKNEDSKVLPLNNVAADANNKATGDNRMPNPKRGGGKVERKSVVMPAEKVDNEISP